MAYLKASTEMLENSSIMFTKIRFTNINHKVFVLDIISLNKFRNSWENRHTVIMFLHIIFGTFLEISTTF